MGYKGPAWKLYASWWPSSQQLHEYWLNFHFDSWLSFQRLCRLLGEDTVQMEVDDQRYMPLQPVKRGDKVWARCDSTSGYVYQFDICTGKADDNWQTSRCQSWKSGCALLRYKVQTVTWHLTSRLRWINHTQANLTWCDGCVCA